MGILQKLLQGFKEKLLLGSSFISGIEVPAPQTKDYLESFRASSLVHSCTKKIGEKMSTIEFELYQLRGLKAKELEQHEIYDLLSNPNPIMTGSQLQEITSIYLSLLGQCYWYKARNGVGKVIELWLMRPDLTKIVPAADGSIAYYKFTNGGKEQRFPAEDVIHFKEPDPLSDYYGYGAVQSVMETIRSDVYAKKWNTRFFYNSARPDAVLTTQSKIGKDDREEIKNNWVRKYGGWENASRVAVLSHGLDYKQVSVNQKDMDFANMRIANRDDILMALGTSKAVMAITDDVSRANADAGLYVFLSETIRPKMEKITDVLNVRLVPEFGEDLLLMSLDPTPDDDAAKDDHYTKAHNKWLTTNEIRMEEGYDPIDGGDYIYQALNLMPMGSDVAPTSGDEKSIVKMGSVAVMKIGGDVKAKDFYDKKKEIKLKAIYKRAMRGRKTLRLRESLINQITIEVVKTIKKIAVENAEKKVEDKEKYTQEQREVLWHEFDKSITGWEKKFKSIVQKLFEEQRERALEALKKSGLGKSVKGSDLELLNFEKEVKIFVKRATPVITDIVKEAGENAMAQVGEKSIKKDFDISDPTTAEFIKMKSTKFAEEVNETTIDKVKNTLAEGVLEGESIKDLAKRVVQVYELRILSSSKTIARTEVLSANNAGSTFGYEQSGVVDQKEWLATLDSKCRASHAGADGQKVDLDKKFKVDGEELSYPGDPEGSAGNIINCRCTVLPVIK
ncbi:MAG: phage portal protein [Parcubacteria group bacterium]|jgi:HK97 family phage portal protein